MVERFVPNPRSEAEISRGIRAWTVVLLGYFLAASAMTFPLVLHAASATWLGVRGGATGDLFMKIWDHWYWTEGIRLDPSSSFTRTELLFFPEGASLAFHSWSAIHVALVEVLGVAVGWISGFNLAALFVLTISGLTAHALLENFVQDRACAFVGGLTFALSPWSLIHVSRHPDLMMLFGLPLLVLALMRIAEGRGMRWSFVGAASLALLGYSGLYLLVVAALTAVPLTLVLGFQRRRYRQRGFWAKLALLVLVASLALSPRLLPVIGSGQALNEAVDDYYGASRSHDLLSFVVPCGNPLVDLRICRQAGNLNLKPAHFLGLVPLGLVALGLTDRARQKTAILWLTVGGLFAVLALGSDLRIGSVNFDPESMPRDWLSELAPVPFKALRNPKFFVPGTLLPLAVLTAIGAARLPRHVGRRRVRGALLAALCLGLLLERWVGAFEPAAIEVSDVYRRLALEREPFALVELPLGRGPSKRYLFHQTVHRHPIVEGALSRTGQESWSTIRSNILLDRWRRMSRGESVDDRCDTPGKKALDDAALSLAAAGIRYVTVQGAASALFNTEFSRLRPILESGEVRAFAMEDVAAMSCRR